VLARSIGNSIVPSIYKPLRDLVGNIDVSAAGNVVLRIGREIDEDGRWEQIAHVVLSPHEARCLRNALGAAIGES
jgi:hypothetical protein